MNKAMSFSFDQETLLIILNASLVCFGASFLLMKVFHSKVLIVCLFMAPFVIFPALQKTGDYQKLIDIYLLTLKYGFLGIILGMVFAEIDKAKRIFRQVSIFSLLARGGISLSGIYIILYFVQSLLQTFIASISSHSMVQTVLGYIGLGNILESPIQGFDIDGVKISVMIIGTCFLVTTFEQYRLAKRNRITEK